LKLFEKITYLDEVRRRDAHSLPPHFLIVR
jgi:hypothetical protein